MNAIISTEEPVMLAKHSRRTIGTPRGLSERRAVANQYASLQTEDVVELCALALLFLCVLVWIILAADSVSPFLSSIQP